MSDTRMEPASTSFTPCWQTPQVDLESIAELALADLRNLHEGNVSRYRLRLSEYRAWQPMQQDGT